MTAHKIYRCSDRKFSNESAIRTQHNINELTMGFCPWSLAESAVIVLAKELSKHTICTGISIFFCLEAFASAPNYIQIKRTLFVLIIIT
uniref:Uncharacterized protein n=1 Tax=Romanomermis culicivorax TaxID=13658 RepID=A0A915KDU6_ROMCU